MYCQDRARMEAELARAHRALTNALDAAEGLQSPGDIADIAQIRVEVTRLAEASLKSKRRPVIKGQLSLQR